MPSQCGQRGKVGLQEWLGAGRAGCSAKPLGRGGRLSVLVAGRKGLLSHPPLKQTHPLPPDHHSDPLNSPETELLAFARKGKIYCPQQQLWQVDHLADKTTCYNNIFILWKYASCL